MTDDWAAAWADEGDVLEVFGDWYDGAVIVELYTGGSFEGETWADPAPVVGIMIDNTSRLVRDAEGNERLSETTLYVPAELVSSFELHARVTVGSNKSKVIRIADFEKYGLFNYRVVNLE